MKKLIWLALNLMVVMLFGVYSRADSAANVKYVLSISAYMQPDGSDLELSVEKRPEEYAFDDESAPQRSYKVQSVSVSGMVKEEKRAGFVTVEYPALCPQARLFVKPPKCTPAKIKRRFRVTMKYSTDIKSIRLLHGTKLLMEKNLPIEEANADEGL